MEKSMQNIVLGGLYQQTMWGFYQKGERLIEGYVIGINDKWTYLSPDCVSKTSKRLEDMTLIKTNEFDKWYKLIKSPTRQLTICDIGGQYLL